MTKGYTISEAADLLGLSTKTIRRRIKQGEIPATLEPGPYGDQYIIPAEAIDTAQQIVDVVRVDRPTDPMTLALVITQALDERDKGLQDEIAQLRQQVETLTRALDERDRQLVEQLQEALLQDRQPWWKRLFGRTEIR
jgi:MerR family copper efflux transcriptional regulator